jgi:hypothetical protein
VLFHLCFPRLRHVILLLANTLPALRSCKKIYPKLFSPSLLLETIWVYGSSIHYYWDWWDLYRPLEASAERYFAYLYARKLLRSVNSRCSLSEDKLGHVPPCLLHYPIPYLTVLNAKASVNAVELLVPCPTEGYLGAVLDILIHDATATALACVAQLRNLMSLRLCLPGCGV